MNPKSKFNRIALYASLTITLALTLLCSCKPTNRLLSEKAQIKTLKKSFKHYMPLSGYDLWNDDLLHFVLDDSSGRKFWLNKLPKQKQIYETELWTESIHSKENIPYDIRSMNLQALDTVLDFGGSSGMFPAMLYTMGYDKIHVIVSDIDSTALRYTPYHLELSKSLTNYYEQALKLIYRSDTIYVKNKTHEISVRTLYHSPDSIFLPDKSVNKIWSNLVMHHVRNRKQACKELFRVLKPRGIVYIRDKFPKKRQKCVNGDYHFSRKDYSKLIKLFEDQGFFLNNEIYEKRIAGGNGRVLVFEKYYE